MPLVTSKEMFEKAYKGGYAIGMTATSRLVFYALLMRLLKKEILGSLHRSREPRP